MKRIVAAAALLLLSFTFALISNYLIINKMSSISEKLRILSNDLPFITVDELSKRTEEIIDEWEGSEWIVHAFINSDSVIETERNLKMLGQLAEQGLTEEFAVYCIDTYSKVDSICDSERINKENIF